MKCRFWRRLNWCIGNNSDCAKEEMVGRDGGIDIQQVDLVSGQIIGVDG